MPSDTYVVLHGSSPDLVWFLDELRREKFDLRIVAVRPYWISAQHGGVWLTILMRFAPGAASNGATERLKTLVASLEEEGSYRVRTTIAIEKGLEEFDPRVSK